MTKLGKYTNNSYHNGLSGLNVGFLETEKRSILQWKNRHRITEVHRKRKTNDFSLYERSTFRNTHQNDIEITFFIHTLGSDIRTYCP